MKNLLNKLMTNFNRNIADVALQVNKHKRMFTFAYLFAAVMSCFRVLAFAADDSYALWRTTEAVLNILFPVFVVIGIILLIVGIILIFVSRFNEQSITGPLIIAAVGAALIVIRALLGNFIKEIAFEQMYPGEKYSDSPFSKK